LVNSIARVVQPQAGRSETADTSLGSGLA